MPWRSATSMLVELLWILAAIVVSAGVAVAIHLHISRRLQINWRTWLSQSRRGAGCIPAGSISSACWPTNRQSRRPHRRGHPRLDRACGRVRTDILQCILQLITFLSVLWVLSGRCRSSSATFEFTLPGYMVWAAVLYALFGSILTYALGRGLIDAGNVRQGREADFRSVLIRARENAEGIALMRGEADERARLHGAWATCAGLERPDARAGQSRPADQFARLSRADRAADRRPAALSRRRAAARRPDADGAGLLQRAVGAVVADRQLPEFADWRASVDRVVHLHVALARPRGQRRGAGRERIVVHDAQPKPTA